MGYLKKTLIVLLAIILIASVYTSFILLLSKSAQSYTIKNNNQDIQEIATHILEQELSLRTYPIINRITGVKQYRITGVTTQEKSNNLICSLVFYDEEYLSNKNKLLDPVGGRSVEGNWLKNIHVYFDIIKEGNTYSRIPCTHAP